MKIKVEFIGAIDSGSHDILSEFEIPKNQSIEEFLNGLHFNPAHIKFIQVVKNGKRASHNDILKSGDKIDLMLMVGGG